MAVPHRTTILPIAFENKIFWHMDQESTTAVLSWGSGICSYMELGTVGSFKTERLFIMSALDHRLNQKTRLLHPTLSKGGHSPGAGSHCSTGVYWHMCTGSSCSWGTNYSFDFFTLQNQDSLPCIIQRAPAGTILQMGCAAISPLPVQFLGVKSDHFSHHCDMQQEGMGQVLGLLEGRH